ncbi:hypothetical protein BDZ90DRAFT_236600, partial [Jaminaea rosea]
MLKPLPLAQPRREQAIQQRAARLHVIARATANQSSTAPPPPQGQVLRLIIALLAQGAAEGQESASDQHDVLPDAIREAALDALNESIRLSDSYSNDAQLAIIETRSGAPGSQSSKSLDSEQPLATIDRALLYRLVTYDARGPITAALPPAQPTLQNPSSTALPCLHAKLRALESLSKGGREVVAFDDIVHLLSGWLSIVWVEVQLLRKMAKILDNPQSSGGVDHHAFVQELSAREWSLQAILHLLTSIIMFSFAKIHQDHIEEALTTVAKLFVSPTIDSGLEEPIAASTARRGSLPNLLVSTKMALAPSSSRSRSRQRQPSMEGYSYFGLENTTPDTGTSTNNSPSMTPRLAPRTDKSAVAPISLATVPPHAGGNNGNGNRGRSRPDDSSSPVPPPQPHPIASFSELHDIEVRCVLKLLDAALKFGLVPLGSIASISEMLCRIIGFEPVSAVLSSPNGISSLANTLSLATLTPWQEAAIPVMANLLRSHSANACIQVVRTLLTDPAAASVEDESTLVGAVLFLRFALLVVARETAANSTQPSAASTSGGSAASKENALAPRLSLSLILPALRGALDRHSDLVDLQVISLVEALLVPGPEASTSLVPGGILPPEDWDELLALALGAKRHTEATFSPTRVPPVLHALIHLLSRVPLAPAEQLGPSPAGSEPRLPWTPRLCSLMLALAPALPSKLSHALLTYYRAHLLCMPGTPGWIDNIHRLLTAFGGPTTRTEVRHAVMALVYDEVYECVVSFPHHRTTLLRQVILPAAKASLADEKDVEVAGKMRKVLVQAAALSSVGNDSSSSAEPSTFDVVRELLCRLARDHLAGTGASHVHFATPAGSHEHRPAATTTAANAEGSTSRTPAPPAKATSFALDLISLFNLIAFASPWIDYDDAGPAEHRGIQEKRARDACLVLFRDLMGLLQPGGETVSTTKLVVLQWFLRIRTDRHHRVFLAENLDDLVAPAAATLLKTSESRAAAAAAAEASAAAASSRSEREARRATTAAANAASEAKRSKSRARDPSMERGRAADRSNDGSRRNGADRSASASRGRQPAAQQAKEQQQQQQKEQPPPASARSPSLWQIPEVLAFEMPESSLRSDIVYTYIHDDDPTCSHTHIKGPDDAHPAPLPVSALLALYIKIIQVERDWEIVSYLICFLPHQLANKHLFCGPKAQDQILVLRQHLCSSIDQQKLMPDLVLPEDVKRSDVYAVSYGTLTTLLSYRALFSRSHQEEMVDSFVSGLNKSQNTALPCVRALSVAVYEAQKSVTRLLPKILVKLSTIMSSMTMSVHILELIASIGQIPACYANFTEQEYRRVFGIALQYIQYHQSPVTSGREDFRSSPALFALSQYVMMLAYYNISLWFMTLRLSDRAKHVPAITRGLLLAASEGGNDGGGMPDNSEVCFDFLARFTHSNIGPKPTRSFLNSVVLGSKAAAGAGSLSKDARASKTWLLGKGLITISTLRREGWVEIVIRRASGTTALLCKLENGTSGSNELDDEDGGSDRVAALMMDRDPSRVGKSVLRAPDVLARAAPFDLARRHADEDGEESSGDEGEEGDPAKRSLEQEAKRMLRAGERLRRRQPLGPGHFGLAVDGSGPRGQRRRGASFSGAISSDAPATASTSAAAHSNDSDPYRLQQPTSDGDQASDTDKDTRTHTGDDAVSAAHEERISAREFSIDPSTVALQLSSYPDISSSTPPLLLPDEPATHRLIKAIDLTPVVDLHKIGCVYVGPGQSTEREILGNRQGSPAYARFMAGLGDLVTLKGQEDVYTGGLDRENDFHGKYAYAWSDDISQIVFHAATMMPDRSGEGDVNHSHKKALIGNDWVHIVFNESGREEYAFGTIPSQFNYVNIVVSPNTRGGVSLGSVGPIDTSYYLVSLQRRPGLPPFSPVGDNGVLVSAGNLPLLVRSLALNANVMCQIVNDTGGEAMRAYKSNWCVRLNHVTRFR